MSDRRIMAASAALAAVGVVSLGLAAFADSAPSDAATPPVSIETTLATRGENRSTTTRAEPTPTLSLPPATNPATTSSTTTSSTTTTSTTTSEAGTESSGETTCRTNAVVLAIEIMMPSGTDRRYPFTMEGTPPLCLSVELDDIQNDRGIIVVLEADVDTEQLCQLVEALSSTVWKLADGQPPSRICPKVGS